MTEDERERKFFPSFFVVVVVVVLLLLFFNWKPERCEREEEGENRNLETAKEVKLHQTTLSNSLF